MRSRLRPQGLLVFDQGFTDRQSVEKPRVIPILRTDEVARRMVIDHEPGFFTVHVIDTDCRDKRGEPHSSSFRYRMLLRDDYERLLVQTGFRDVRFYGLFSADPYSRAASHRLIVIGTRHDGEVPPQSL